MTVKKPEAILFDWDNTLADTWPIIYAALNKTFADMGHDPWTFEEVKGGRDNIHHALRDSFPGIFGAEHWEKAREIYYKYFLQVHLQEIKPLDDVEPMLQALKDSDIFVGIVSNKTGDYLRKEVEHLGWGHYFSSIIGATDAEEDKPSAKPLYLALEGSNIHPDTHHVWMVGDSATDVKAGLNANCEPQIYGDLIVSDEIKSDHRLQNDIVRHKNHLELFEYIQHII